MAYPSQVWPMPIENKEVISLPCIVCKKVDKVLTNVECTQKATALVYTFKLHLLIGPNRLSAFRVCFNCYYYLGHTETLFYNFLLRYPGPNKERIPKACFLCHELYARRYFVFNEMAYKVTQILKISIPTCVLSNSVLLCAACDLMMTELMALYCNFVRPFPLLAHYERPLDLSVSTQQKSKLFRPIFWS